MVYNEHGKSFRNAIPFSASLFNYSYYFGSAIKNIANGFDKDLLLTKTHVFSLKNENF